MEKLTMSRKEINQISTLEQLKSKKITQVMAAEILGLTERQVRNKLKDYRAGGAKSLIHKSRGRPGNRAWSKKEKERALEAIRNHYPDFGPTFAAEKLGQNHAIFINKESLRQAMSQAKMWHPKKGRVRYRKWRARKPMFGIMIQLDGSDHDWFEGRGPRCFLLVFIDDATSKVVWAEFVTGESVQNVMRASRNYFRKYGLPVSIYVDNASVFRVNTNNPDRTKITQYKRAMDEIGIDLMFARSPQAKGRVERVHQTLQDRLVKELRLAKISDMDTANRFLKEHYIDIHNAKFSVEPANPNNAHRPLCDINLDLVLCVKSKRILTNDFTISYRTRTLQIERQSHVIARPKDDVTVSELLDGSIILTLRNKSLAFTEISEKPVKPKSERIYTNIYYKPAQNHPWRLWVENPKKAAQMEVI